MYKPVDLAAHVSLTVGRQQRAMPALKDNQDSEARAAVHGTSEPGALTTEKAVMMAAAAGKELPPKVVSVDPAMFVPLDFDITEPLEPPGSRVDYAQSMLQTADFYRTGVRRGMVYLADLDRRRILATAAQATAHEGEMGEKGDDDGLKPEEADMLVHSMQAPFQPAAKRSYVMTDQDLSLHSLQLLPEVDKPGRKEAGRQLQQVIELVLGKMGSYDGHICAVRSRWAADLEQEQGLMAEQFGKLSTADSAVDGPGTAGTAGAAVSEMKGVTARATATPSEDVPMAGT